MKNVWLPLIWISTCDGLELQKIIQLWNYSLKLKLQLKNEEMFSLDTEFLYFSPEYRRIDAFEMWCWRRLLRVPWTSRRYNQSILKEFSPEYSLEGLTMQLILQYFGHLMLSFEKNLMLGKIGGRRRRGWQRMRWLDGITDSMDMSWVNSRSKLQVVDREA